MEHAKVRDLDHRPRRAYAFADSLIGSSLDSAAGGLVISAELGGSLFDSIARRRAGRGELLYAHFPSLLGYHSILRRDGVSSQVADVLAEPIMLGRCDGSLRIFDEAAGQESYGAHLLETSTRSIDSWCNGRPQLRLLHLGDSALLFDQLVGAGRTIERDRPIVTVYTSKIDRPMLLSFLSERDYATIDLAGRPAGPACADAMDFGWIALPREQLETSLSAARHSADEATFSEWTQTMVQNAVPRQRSSRAIFGLPDSAPEFSTTVSAADLIADGNCYREETDGRMTWRWLGPRPRTRMCLPCPLPGMSHIEVSVMSPRIVAGSSDYRVLVEGREVRTTITGNTIGFVAQQDCAEYAGFLTVDLISTAPPVSIGGDKRTLRLSIQSVTVSPWQ